jgi:hypothetical protein
MSSTIPFPPREQLYNRYYSNKHTHQSVLCVEEEEAEEDLFVFNDTIEGPRAPAVKPGRVVISAALAVQSPNVADAVARVVAAWERDVVLGALQQRVCDSVVDADVVRAALLATRHDNIATSRHPPRKNHN